jgi:hypothetical protein
MNEYLPTNGDFLSLSSKNKTQFLSLAVEDIFHCQWKKSAVPL